MAGVAGNNKKQKFTLPSEPGGRRIYYVSGELNYFVADRALTIFICVLFLRDGCLLLSASLDQ